MADFFVRALCEISFKHLHLLFVAYYDATFFYIYFVITVTCVIFVPICECYEGSYCKY